MSGRIALTDSTLSGGVRDVMTVFGPVGLRVEGNVLSGARGKLAAGLHIRAADRGQPTLDVQVTGNKVAANSGPGIFLDLAPANGFPVLASGIEIARNEILGNAREASRGRRGGIVIAGRQNDGRGQILVHENFFHGNRGPDVLRRQAHVDAVRLGPRSVPRRRPAQSETTPHGSKGGSMPIGTGRSSCRGSRTASATRRAASGSRATGRTSRRMGRASSRSGSARSGCTRSTVTRSPRARSSSSTARRPRSRPPST